MTCPFWAAAFLWWWRIIPPACAGVGLAWGIRWWVRQWREASSLIDEVAAMGDTPVPYVPTSEGLDAIARAVTCPWCRDEPHGRCTCGVACRHWRCVRFTRDELDILDGKKAL